MSLRALLALLFGLTSALAAQAEDLVVALSTRDVAITSNYTGADITVFGLIERDARSMARPGGYDVVAHVRGPVGEVIVQRKGNFGPIWLTENRSRYASIPLFFSVLSSRPLADVADADTRAKLKLGLEHYLPPIPPGKEAEEEREFRAALLRLRAREEALLLNEKGIELIRPNLFSARVSLPAKAPPGLYIVNLTLLADGTPLKSAQAGFVVRKAGFDAFVYGSARNEPMYYGLFAVLMAIFLGYIANVVFRRD
jgi:uncharacterized protein (TIGR02186 family)